MRRQVSGLYHRRGWTVEVGEDAEADEVLVASIHEAMHDRLQMTTLFGRAVTLLQERATLDADTGVIDAAQSLQWASTRVHEEFATWMSTIPAGWGPDKLEEAFPVYVRHLRRAARLTSALPGPYIAMHALQGASRACMQSSDLADLLERVPPMTLNLAMLEHGMRPDSRLLRLEHGLRARGWGPLGAWRGDSADLSPERFAEDNDPAWAELNRTAYDWCRGLLEDAGCRTLPYDGHLESVGELAASLGISGEPDDAASSFIALMAVESETMVLGDRLPAVVLPRETPPTELLAGDLERRHLFLAIRPRPSLTSQYALTGAPLSLTDHVAVLRCQREDGVVELLDVTHADPLQLSSTGPTVVSIAMSSLAEPAIHRYWGPLLGRHQSTVLCDLRPSVNIRHWLRDPSLRLRYSIVGIESHAGTIRMLVFQIEDGTITSRMYIAPISRLYSSGLLLWFAESPDMARRTVRDDTLGDTPLLRFVAAHTLLEERIFAFASETPHDSLHGTSRLPRLV